MSEQGSVPEGPETSAVQPKRAGRVYTLLAYAVILGMVVMYFNSTVTYWQGISNQKQREIDQLIRELDTARLEFEESHANLTLKEKQALGLEGVEKEGELEIDGELLSLYELFSLPPGMDEYYDERRNSYIERYGGSYLDINLFRAMMVLHDSGQAALNGGWYRELYGKEPSMVARNKLVVLIKRLSGYESIEGKEKIPRLRETIRIGNLGVLSSFVQFQIENLAREDYPRFPLETLSLRSGDSEDKVMLLAALLEIEGYETGLLTIFDAENNFYHNALAVKDEGGWIRNKLMFRGYEREGFAWILLDPYLKTELGELPEWSERYRSASGAIEIPGTKYVFTAIDARAVKSEMEKHEGPLERNKTGIIALERGKRTNINILAVVNNVGVILPVQTEIRDGEGRLLLNIDDTLYFIDTQSSMAIALRVAKSLTRAKLADKDIIIRVDNPYSETLALSGESAGSSIAVALTANLLDKKIKSDVLLTGEIREDGSIGRVGDIPIKAEAARNAGVKTLLVPKRQGITRAGIEVVEVSSIEEALPYMLE